MPLAVFAVHVVSAGQALHLAFSQSVAQGMGPPRHAVWARQGPGLTPRHAGAGSGLTPRRAGVGGLTPRRAGGCC
eukprot:332440-Pyramimonas_sp.AAC.1